MGIYDRDYYRNPQSAGSAVGRLRMWSVVTWLIAINIAVFVLDAVLLRGGVGYRLGGMVMGPLEAWGYFSRYTAVEHLQLWRFVTFQFLHADLGHIFFNMLSLYYFGPMVEGYLGARRFLAFYLTCGVAGAALYLVLSVVGFFGRGELVGYVPMVGASAGIFGVLVAAARLAPDTQVMLLFPPIPLNLRTMAWIMLAIAAYTVLFRGANAGGQAGHLGGAAMGFLLIRNVRWLNWADRDWLALMPRKRRNKLDWRRGPYRGG